MKIRPANPKHSLACPQTGRVVPPEGCDVPDTMFWRRRVLFKEFIPVDDVEKPEPETSTADGATETP